MKEIQRRAAEQLTLPEDVPPSDELPLFKRYLKNEENLLKKLHREGGLGREVCRARAALMDALILNLFGCIWVLIENKNSKIFLRRQTRRLADS